MQLKVDEVRTGTEVVFSCGPVLSKNPIDAVRRADSTLDARRGRDVRDRREPLLGSPCGSRIPNSVAKSRPGTPLRGA